MNLPLSSGFVARKTFFVLYVHEGSDQYIPRKLQRSRVGKGAYANWQASSVSSSPPPSAAFISVLTYPGWKATHAVVFWVSLDTRKEKGGGRRERREKGKELRELTNDSETFFSQLTSKLDSVHINSSFRNWIYSIDRMRVSFCLFSRFPLFFFVERWGDSKERTSRSDGHFTIRTTNRSQRRRGDKDLFLSLLVLFQ